MSKCEEDDNIYKALASAVRRNILDELRLEPLTTGAICSRFAELDRCTVMQHMKVLEKADLIIPEKHGRERWNHLNPLPIRVIHDRWIGPYAAHAVAKLGDLKGRLEQEP